MSKLSKENRNGKKTNPCKGKTGRVLKVCIEQYEYKKKLNKKDSLFNKRHKKTKSEYDNAKKLPDTTYSKTGQIIN